MCLNYDWSSIQATYLVLAGHQAPVSRKCCLPRGQIPARRHRRDHQGRPGTTGHNHRHRSSCYFLEEKEDQRRGEWVCQQGQGGAKQASCHLTFPGLHTCTDFSFCVKNSGLWDQKKKQKNWLDKFLFYSNKAWCVVEKQRRRGGGRERWMERRGGKRWNRTDEDKKEGRKEQRGRAMKEAVKEELWWEMRNPKKIVGRRRGGGAHLSGTGCWRPSLPAGWSWSQTTAGWAGSRRWTTVCWHLHAQNIHRLN